MESTKRWKGHAELAFTRAAEYQIVLSQPAWRWSEGTILGNGDLGLMVYGSPDRLVLAVNKSDVWDYRHPEHPVVPSIPWVELADRVRAGDREALAQVEFNQGRTIAYPSLQPCGELVMALAAGEMWEAFEQRLSLFRAETSVSYRPIYCAVGGPHQNRPPVEIDVFVCATYPVAGVRLSPQEPILGRGVQPSFLLSLSRSHNPLHDRPGYGGEGRDLLLSQRFPDGFRYVLGCRVEGEVGAADRGLHGSSALVQLSPNRPTTIYLSVATSRESANPEGLCRERLEEAERRGFDALRLEHQRWWEGYWGESAVEIADRGVERDWYFGLYILGSACREHTPPIGLQGLWNDSHVPAWNADYHNDTNLQLNYWSAYPTGHLDFCLPLIRMMARDWLSANREAASYYGCRGLKLPIGAGPDGNNLGGHWGSWQGATGWMAQFFIWYWRYSRDRAFLTEFYPYLKECALYYEDCFKEGGDGRLHLFPDLSPEQSDEERGCWGEDATLTLSFARYLFRELAGMAEELGIDADQRETWRAYAERIAPYPQEDGHLIDLRGKNYAYRHRHTSRLSPVHPVGEIGLGSPPEERELGLRSYREFTSYDDEPWGGYSGVLLAAVAARLGLGEEACRHLRDVSEGFAPSNRLNAAHGPLRFLQVEANLGLPYSVCETLLQSHDELIRLFPAVPEGWSGRFHGLLTFGAFRVSAACQEGQCTVVRITSLAGRPVRLLNPFGGPVLIEPQTEDVGQTETVEGEIVELETTPGGEYRFTPTEPPPEPRRAPGRPPAAG